MPLPAVSKAKLQPAVRLNNLYRTLWSFGLFSLHDHLISTSDLHPNYTQKYLIGSIPRGFLAHLNYLAAFAKNPQSP
jgi:hypothetical protein